MVIIIDYLAHLKDNDVAWMFVSKDKKEVVVSFVRQRALPHPKFESLKLVGLEEDASYEIVGEDAVFLWR